MPQPKPDERKRANAIEFDVASGPDTRVTFPNVSRRRITGSLTALGGPTT